jgi:predicted GIY-YIG superfamily endonuclease
MAEDDPFFVYILRCFDGSYYVGHARDVEARAVSHNEGNGARWTAKRLPVVLVYTERIASEAEAVARERQLKGWSRAKKEALISGDFAALKRSSRARPR